MFKIKFSNYFTIPKGRLIRASYHFCHATFLLPCKKISPSACPWLFSNLARLCDIQSFVWPFLEEFHSFSMLVSRREFYPWCIPRLRFPVIWSQGRLPDLHIAPSPAAAASAFGLTRAFLAGPPTRNSALSSRFSFAWLHNSRYSEVGWMMTCQKLPVHKETDFNIWVLWLNRRHILTNT